MVSASSRYLVLLVIGVVLALALGFGLLFLHYYTSFATQATALLFGNVLAVDRSMIATLAGLARAENRSSPEAARFFDSVILCLAGHHGSSRMTARVRFL